MRQIATQFRTLLGKLARRFAHYYLSTNRLIVRCVAGISKRRHASQKGIFGLIKSEQRLAIAPRFFLNQGTAALLM